MKHQVNQQMSLLDKLFLKGDILYIDTQTYRNSGSSIDWMKVFNSDKKLLGSITSSKYWGLAKHGISRVHDDTPSLQEIDEKYQKLKEAHLNLIDKYYDLCVDNQCASGTMKDDLIKRSGL